MKRRARARQAICDNIILRKLLACLITKATDTHSEYALGVLIAFPQQQLLHERFSLRYTYCTLRVLSSGRHRATFLSAISVELYLGENCRLDM
jgi:hypothetical protein